MARNSDTSQWDDKHFVDLLRVKNWGALFLRMPNFKADFITTIIVSILIGVLELGIPLFILQSYDHILTTKDFDILSWMTWTILVIFLISGVLRMCRATMSMWFVARVEYLLGVEAVDDLLSLSLDSFDAHRPNLQVERLGAVDVIKEYYGSSVVPLLVDIPFVIIYVLLYAWLGGGALVLFSSGIMGGFALFVAINRRKYTEKKEVTERIMHAETDFLVETLGSLHTVKGLVMEELLMRRYESLQKSSASRNLRLSRLARFPIKIADTVSLLHLLGVVLIGVLLVQAGSMTMGVVLATAYIATRIMAVAQAASLLLLKHAEADAAYTLILELREKELAPLSSRVISFPDIQGDIRFSKVSLDKSESLVSLKDLTFEISKGECIGVVGDVPQQTEMFAHLLCGLKQPDTGAIFIDEFNMRRWDHSHFCGRIAYLPRDGQLFHGTIMDNLTLFNLDKKELALDAAKILHLDKVVAELPQGYETIVGVRPGDLPSGMIQRICIARALTVRPRILVLDRTLRGLDVESHRIFEEVLIYLRGKCTIITVADHGQFACPPHRIFTIKRGVLHITSNLPEMMEVVHG